MLTMSLLAVYVAALLVLEFLAPTCGPIAHKADHDDFEAFAKVMAPNISNDPEEQDTEIWRSYSRNLMSSNEFLYLD